MNKAHKGRYVSKKKEGRQAKSVWGRPAQADSRIRGAGARRGWSTNEQQVVDVTGKVEAMAELGYLALCGNLVRIGGNDGVDPLDASGLGTRA